MKFLDPFTSEGLRGGLRKFQFLRFIEVVPLFCRNDLISTIAAPKTHGPS